MLLAIPFGLAIGLGVGLLGGGGAVLAVPVLVYVLDQDVHSATTASLAVVAAASLAGGLAHARSNRVCWRHVTAFAPAAVAGAVAGTVANQAVGADVLLVGVAALMVGAAVAMWRRGGRDAAAIGEDCPPVEPGRDAVAGLAVGGMTGLFGVGGGFVVVPTLAIALGFPMRCAVGTSLVIVSAVSVVGLAAHFAAGSAIDPAVTAQLAGACVAGAIAGQGLAPRLSQRLLTRSFAVVLVAVAAYIAARTLA